MRENAGIAPVKNKANSGEQAGRDPGGDYAKQSQFPGDAGWDEAWGTKGGASCTNKANFPRMAGGSRSGRQRPWDTVRTKPIPESPAAGGLGAGSTNKANFRQAGRSPWGSSLGPSPLPGASCTNKANSPAAQGGTGPGGQGLLGVVQTKPVSRRSMYPIIPEFH